MIQSFNRKQTGKAIVSALLCIVATILTYIIASWAWRFCFSELELKKLVKYAPVFGVGMLVAAWISGFSLWRRGFGKQDFLESPFGSSFDSSQSGGAMWINYELLEIKGGSYVLSQMALASPFQGLRTYDLLRSRIVDTRDQKESLEFILEKIRAQGKWHSIKHYEGREREVMYLARMGKISFSARRGSVRIV